MPPMMMARNRTRRKSWSTAACPGVIVSALTGPARRKRAMTKRATRRVARPRNLSIGVPISSIHKKLLPYEG